MALPGDYCGKPEECVQVEGVTCSASMCTSSLGAGDGCSTSNQCPAGHFCSTDVPEAMVCTVARKAGESCDNINLCSYDTMCAQLDEAEENKCFARGELKDGQKFTLIFERPSNLGNFEAAEDVDPAVKQNLVCETNYAITIEEADLIYECRKGARNIDP
jgi:hypothetical protein